MKMSWWFNQVRNGNPDNFAENHLAVFGDTFTRAEKKRFSKGHTDLIRRSCVYELDEENSKLLEPWENLKLLEL